MKEIKVRCTFTEEVLGTASGNPELHREFIASKGPNATTIEEEVAALGEDAVEKKEMTVFAKDGDKPFLWDYQIKGFFKGACKALQNASDKDPETGKKKAVNESGKLTAYKSKIDLGVFVTPRAIPFEFDGSMGVCQRPLRAQTAQGERIALASSETVPAGAVIEFTVTVFNDNWIPLVREWLNYGIWSGMGQWRNSGKGRFYWEELDENGNVIGGNAAA